jgi:predicted GNAT family N-acyltransferase
MMAAAREWANGNYASLYLHSQVGVVEFYKKLGFSTEGEIFDEAGTPHITMRLALNSAKLQAVGEHEFV